MTRPKRREKSRLKLVTTAEAAAEEVPVTLPDDPEAFPARFISTQVAVVEARAGPLVVVELTPSASTWLFIMMTTRTMVRRIGAVVQAILDRDVCVRVSQLGAPPQKEICSQIWPQILYFEMLQQKSWI